MRLFLNRFLAKPTFVLIGLMLASSAWGQTLQIDSLKANYMEGFIDFIRRDGLALPDRTFIGIIGDNDLAAHLETLANSENRTRTLKIQKISAELLEHTDNCNFDLIFIGAGQKKRWKELFAQLENCKALVIGEEGGFINAGGTIEFIVIKNRLRFRVDPRNLDKSGLKLSSKLLELAVQ